MTKTSLFFLSTPVSLFKAKSRMSFQPVARDLTTFLLVRGEQQWAPTAPGAPQRHAEQPATRFAWGLLFSKAVSHYKCCSTGWGSTAVPLQSSAAFPYRSETELQQ